MLRLAQVLLSFLIFMAQRSDAFTLSGFITSDTGAPLAGIPVDVLRISPTSGNLVRLSTAGGVSGTDGGFTTADLAPGEYWLRANNTTNDSLGVEFPTGYEGLYYYPDGNQPDRDSTRPVIVGAGTGEISGFDFSLRPAYRVSGRVTAPAGTDLATVDFDVYDATSGLFLPLLNTKADANGDYVLYGFASGVYHLKCDPEPVSGLYPVFQGNEFMDLDAQPLLVNGSDQVVDFSLSPGFTLSGTVRANGSPQLNVDMDLYQVRSNRVVFIPDPAVTDPVAGVYTSSLLPAAVYVIRADPLQQSGFQPISYYTTNQEPAMLFEMATPVELTAGSRNGLDIDLFAGGKFQGFVFSGHDGSALVNADIDVYTIDGVRTEADAKTGVNGFFSTDNLLPGDYIIRADPPPGTKFVRNYASTNDATHFEDAMSLALVAGQSFTGLTLRLPLGGVIGGKITDQQGNPLGGIDLDVYEAASGRGMEANATSDTNGTYALDALPPGDYQVRADPENGLPWVRQYYSNTFSSADALAITVMADALYTNIDFALASGGYISGSVMTTNNQPLAGYDIDVFDAAGKFVPVDAATDASGNYMVGALPEGAYAVRADGPEGSLYVQQYAGGGYFVEDANRFAVEANQVLTNVNIRLSSGGYLSGRVEDTNGSAVAQADLDLFDDLGRRMEMGGTSDAEGFYSAGPLPPGLYTIRFEPIPGSFLVTTYYPAGFLSEQAVAVRVDSGVTNLLAPVVTQTGGMIAGVIRSTNGQALAHIDLDAFSPDGTRLEENAESSADGSYMMGPFAEASVVIRADPGSQDPYVRQYYDHASYQSAATSVVIEPGRVTSNINFELISGAIISGRVVFTNQQPLAGLDMDVYAAGGGLALEQTALTGADGTYQLGPVPEGAWVVRVHPTAAQGYQTRYYPNAGNIISAEALMVEQGRNVSNINLEVGVNQPPVAALGAFGGISNGYFSLNYGPSSDPDGDRLLYRWVQVAGPTITVTNADATSLGFLLPSGTDERSVVTLQYFVEDFSMTSAAQTIHISTGNPAFTTVSRSGSNVHLAWTVGTFPQPYVLQYSSNHIHWQGISTGNLLEADTELNQGPAFFRLTPD